MIAGRVFDLQRFSEIEDFLSHPVTSKVVKIADDQTSISNDGGSDLVILGSNRSDFLHTKSRFDYGKSGGNNVTIISGDGNDTINNYCGDNVIVDSGSGNDSIYNAEYYWKGTHASYVDEWKNFGKNISINAGSGGDYILDYGDNSTIYGGDGDDYIKSGAGGYDVAGNHLKASDSIIFAGKGNDTIKNDGDGALIKSEDGNDVIYHYDGVNSTMDGGNGDDTIRIFFDTFKTSYGTVVDGGSGNDLIIFPHVKSGKTITVKGGVGDDSINCDGGQSRYEYVNGNVDYDRAMFIYSYGDGNDTISGFDKYDTLQIAASFNYNTVLSDNSLYIKFDNRNSIVLKNVNANSISNFNIVTVQGGGENNTPDNGNNGDDKTTSQVFGYAQLTTAQKKEVRENSVESLKSLLSIADDMDVELSSDDFDDKNLFSKAQGWTKFAKFIANLCLQGNITKIDEVENFFTMLDDFNVVLTNVEDIVTGKKPLNDLSASTAIMDYGANVLDMLQNFSEALGVENAVVDFSLIGSVVGFASNVVALADGSSVSDEDRQELEKAFIDVMGAIVGYTVKTYDVADKLIGGVKIGSPFGPINAGVAALTGLVTGVDQFFSSNAKYKNDGLATATQNAWIDAFSTGIYEAAHKYTFGADDAIFEGVRWLAYNLTGKGDQYTDSDLNYMEWIGTAAKISFLGEVHGNDADNGIETVEEKTKVVAGGGNDFIIKNHSQVTIYGGEGSDTLGGFQLKGKEKNYVDMGDGNDSVTVYDKNSTIYGGKGDDTIKVMGVQSSAVNVYATDNKVYGDDGNDIIYLNKANLNTVRGGAGNDTIGLVNSSKTYIEYKEGDGIDSIVGYGETDTIRLTRVMSSYSTVESGNNVLIYVGSNNEGLILVDAKGKKINLSADNTPKKEDMNVLQIKQGTINGANLRVSAVYEGDIWAGDDDNLRSLKVIDAKTNSHGGILAGNGVSNSIVGGNGRNSLWGGVSGDNTLTGGTARDQFWYGGNGKDIVTNFSAGNGANNDVVVLFGGELSRVSRSGANVALNMSNGNAINLKTNSSSAEDVILYSTDGNNIFGAKIGASSTKSLNYDGSVNYFQLNGGGTLNVTGAGENNVWLDGSQGQAFSGISNINATGNGKNILAGNGENNSIISGTGESSLWGGAGNSADTLIGGSGANMFWYGKNDGDDIVNNASSGDVVNLYDVSLADITAATGSGNKISVTFNTGGHLHIDSAENLSPTFNLADGSWKYNHSSGNWQNA